MTIVSELLHVLRNKDAVSMQPLLQTMLSHSGLIHPQQENLDSIQTLGSFLLSR